MGEGVRRKRKKQTVLRAVRVPIDINNAAIVDQVHRYGKENFNRWALFLFRNHLKKQFPKKFKTKSVLQEVD